MSAAAVEWEEFLELAEELVRRDGNLGAERSATSRVYFAAFHRAAAYASVRGVRLTYTGADHVLVWDWFLRPDADRTSHRIGEIGHWLRRARQWADYDAGPLQSLSAAAESAVRLARRIGAELERATSTARLVTDVRSLRPPHRAVVVPTWEMLTQDLVDPGRPRSPEQREASASGTERACEIVVSSSPLGT